MNRTKSILQAATFGLALTFTFSCSDDKDDGGGGCESTNTHYCYNGTGNLKEYGYVTHGSQTYKTVVIGSQTWMAENLNYNASGSICHNNIEFYCNTYGRLYDWNTAQSVCPSGWHLPSKGEWETLISFVGTDAGTKLKATNGWNYIGVLAGPDDYGFSALPGGYGFPFPDQDVYYFSNAGIYGRWWSASESNSDYAYNMDMDKGVGYDSSRKDYLFSVRCLQN